MYTLAHSYCSSSNGNCYGYLFLGDGPIHDYVVVDCGVSADSGKRKGRKNPAFFQAAAELGLSFEAKTRAVFAAARKLRLDVDSRFLSQRGVILSKDGKDYLVAVSLLVTHGHCDHIDGVPGLAKKLKAKVYVHRDLAVDRPDLVMNMPWYQVHDFAFDDRALSGGACFVGTLVKISAFPVPHDVERRRGARDDARGQRVEEITSVGYRIETPGLTVVHTGDLGHVPDDILVHFNRADVIVCDANYDEDLAVADKRPPEIRRPKRGIKRRVHGNRGHMSNQRCAELLSRLKSRGLCPNLRLFVASHLADVENSPERVMTIIPRGWGKKSRGCPAPSFVIAARHDPTRLYEFDKGKFSAGP